MFNQIQNIVIDLWRHKSLKVELLIINYDNLVDNLTNTFCTLNVTLFD